MSVTDAVVITDQPSAGLLEPSSIPSASQATGEDGQPQIVQARGSVVGVEVSN